MMSMRSHACIVLLVLIFLQDCASFSNVQTDKTTNTAMFASSQETSSRPTIIENFRQARGLTGIYRCANTDGLAKVMEYSELDEAERLVLYDAGLIIDLRSPSERKEQNAKSWMSRAPGGPISVRHDNQERSNKRSVLRLDILSASKLWEYAERNWFTPQQKALAGWYKAVDVEKLHDLRIEALNEKGLLGLYQALLAIGQSDFLTALQEITVHLEEQKGPVVIHCVQGKDRTGLLVMLCQSIMKVSDEDMADDYFKSHVMQDGQWARSNKGKLDRQEFSGAPKFAIKATLDFIRERYGSVSSGYLDEIGFTQSWRDRFVTSVQQGAVKPSETADVMEIQSKL